MNVWWGCDFVKQSGRIWAMAAKELPARVYPKDEFVEICQRLRGNLNLKPSARDKLARWAELIGQCPPHVKVRWVREADGSVRVEIIE